MAHQNILKKIRQFLVDLSGRADRAAEIYTSLFEESHSIMLIIHPETGNIIDANAAACAYYHYPKDQLTSLQIMDINTLNEEEICNEMQQAKAEKKNYFSFRHRLATGEIRDVEVYSSPIMLAGRQVLYSIIHDITARLTRAQERESLIADLEKAMAEIKVLRGILPLCSFCKKIRDPGDSWHEVDAYIHKHSSADISHTVCPECIKEHYPEYDPSRADE